MATFTSTNLKMVLIVKTFFLVPTKCKKIDYWFEKPGTRGPNFSLTYKHNYQNFTHLKRTNATTE
jgi:hypothetical protein